MTDIIDYYLIGYTLGAITIAVLMVLIEYTHNIDGVMSHMFKQ